MSNVLYLDHFLNPKVFVERSAARSLVLSGEEREKRRDQWRVMQMRHEFYERLRDLVDIASVNAYHGYGPPQAANYAELYSEEIIPNQCRKALRDRLFTPAPTYGALKWKRDTIKKRDFWLREFMPTSEEIERQFAEDEACLAANARRRHGEGKRGES